MKLTRLEQTATATFGTLTDEDNKPFGVTLELPWRGNARAVSCIPAGVYSVRRRYSPHHGYDLFGLESVPDRSDVEIHIGNTTKDTEGCILLGSNYARIGSENGIAGSQRAFAKFMSAMRGIDTFTLTITDPR